MERIAIFPGSFDPFTRGHEALVEQALRLFDRVIIGIGNNPEKHGLLPIENRRKLIADLYAREPRIEARIYAGLTGDFARETGACAILRGVRNTTDFEYERTMEATNHRIYPENHHRDALYPLRRGRHRLVDRARSAGVRTDGR